MNSHRIDTKSLSQEEKYAYLSALENSNVSVSQFCEENGLSKDFIYYWRKHKKRREEEGEFSCLQVNPFVDKKNLDEKIQVQMKLPRDIQLRIELSVSDLIVCLRGLCDGA